MVVVVKVVKVNVEVDVGARLTFCFSTGMTASAKVPSKLAKQPDGIAPGGLILLVTPCALTAETVASIGKAKRIVME